MTTDHYAILGVPRGADLKDIKLAHRALARKYHPDLNANPSFVDKCAAINVAWDVLSDPAKRKRLDTLLHTEVTACGTCAGSGKVWRQRGFKNKLAVTCPTCKGTGSVL